MDGAGPRVVDGAAERLPQVERLQVERLQAVDGAERLQAVTVPPREVVVTVLLREVEVATVLLRAERRQVVVLERLRAGGLYLLLAERWRRAAAAA